MENYSKLLFVASLIGIFSLILLSQIRTPNKIGISEAKILEEGSFVKISGKIIQFQEYPDFSLITLEDDSGKIKVLCDKNKNTGLINKSVEIAGIIKDYEGENEVVAEEIVLIEN